MSDEIRNTKGQFKKGVSGNPQGRAVRLPQIEPGASVQELFAMNTTQVFVELYNVIIDRNTPATAKVAAIKEYHDRAYGKSPTSLVVRRDDNNEAEVDLSGLSDEMLRKVVNVARARIAQQGDDE